MPMPPLPIRRILSLDWLICVAGCISNVDREGVEKSEFDGDIRGFPTSNH